MAINNNYDPKTNKGTSTPKNYKRGNPIPLDSSAVWNSLASAQDYAQTDPTAYVGQIISVLDGEDVTAYIIKDEAGTLEAIGTGTGESVDLSEIQAAIEALDTKIDETHESVRDTSTVAGGSRYGIYYEDDHLNIDSRNTVEMSFIADTSGFEPTVAYDTFYNDAKSDSKLELREGGNEISEFEISEGSDAWRTQTWGNDKDFPPKNSPYTSRTFFFKQAGLLTSQIVDYSNASSWKMTSQWAKPPFQNTALGTANYLAIDGKISYVVGNATEIGLTYKTGDKLVADAKPDDCVITNDACAVIGDHVVSFKLCHVEDYANEQGGPFDYIKATVRFDTCKLMFNGERRQGVYDNFEFYLVEPKYRGRMTSSAGGAPADGSAFIYPITTDLSDESAIWTPTYCNNYVHRFMIYKNPEGRYFSVSAGSTADPTAGAPAKIVNGFFSKGKRYYQIQNKKAIPMAGTLDRSALETAVDLYKLTTGNSDLIPYNTPVLYPSHNTGKLFGVDPKKEFVIEEDLGAFSYNYTQKLNYVPDGKQLQLSRVNPVGSYQIIKIENQGRLYLDNDDIMIVPEAQCIGTVVDLHSEIIGTPGARKLYTQIIKVERWKQASRQDICTYNNVDEYSDSLKYQEYFKTLNWETGTRIFYRTVTNQTSTIKGTLYKDGLSFENCEYSGVKNWSALHELVTSENIGSYFAADIENFELNIGTNTDGTPKKQTLGEFASGVELTINAAIESAVINMGDTQVTLGELGDAVNDINLSMKGFDDNYATKSEVANVTQTATNAATEAATQTVTTAMQSYATKTEVNNVTKTATDAATSAATGAATAAATQAVATAISESKLVTESDMQTYVTSQVVTPDLSGYATKEDLGKISSGLSADEVREIVQDATSNLTSPDLSGYVTDSDLAGYVTETELEEALNNINIPEIPETPDLDNYYTKTEINDIVSSIQIPGTPETPDLTNYYNKSEVDSMIAGIQIPEGADPEVISSVVVDIFSSSSGSLISALGNTFVDYGTLDYAISSNIANNSSIEDTIKDYAEDVVSSYCEPYNSALSSMETAIADAVSSVSMCYEDMPSVASDAFASMIETDFAEALSSNETLSDIIKNHANEVVTSFCSDPFSEISSSLGTMSSQLEDLVSSGGNNVAMSGDIPISLDSYDYHLIPDDSDDINNFISSNSSDGTGYFKFFIQVCGSDSTEFSGVFETDDVYLMPNTVTTYEAIPARVSFPPSIFTPNMFTNGNYPPSTINQGSDYYITIKYDSSQWKFYITSDSNGYGSSVISGLYTDPEGRLYNKLVIAKAANRPF